MRRHCSGLKALPSHPSHPTSFRILGVFAMLKRSARAIPPFNLGYKSRAVGSLRRGESVQSATISSDLSVSRVGPWVYTHLLFYPFRLSHSKAYALNSCCRFILGFIIRDDSLDDLMLWVKLGRPRILCSVHLVSDDIQSSRLSRICWVVENFNSQNYTQGKQLFPDS